MVVSANTSSPCLSSPCSAGCPGGDVISYVRGLLRPILQGVILLLLLMMHCVAMMMLLVATRTRIVRCVLPGLRMVVLLVVVMLVAGVEPVFVLKVSALGVRKQVGEVIVRIVIVRGAIMLLLQVVGASYHPVCRVGTVRGEGVGDSLGKQKVREFIGIPTTTTVAAAPQIIASFASITAAAAVVAVARD